MNCEQKHGLSHDFWGPGISIKGVLLMIIDRCPITKAWLILKHSFRNGHVFVTYYIYPHSGAYLFHRFQPLTHYVYVKIPPGSVANIENNEH